MSRRSWFIYGTLLAIWILLIGWQGAEHIRVRRSARAALINRARDISNTLGLLMRSQRFFGVISIERLEPALNELVAQGELRSVELLNASEEVVASAGEPIEAQAKGGGVQWGDHTVTLINLVDLGTNVTQELQPTNLTLVMPARELRDSFQTNRARFSQMDTNAPSQPGTNDFAAGLTNGPPRRHRHGFFGTNEFNSFQRPSWMSASDYNALIQKKGVHSFVIAMSTDSLDPICRQDLWLRAFIGFLATISVAVSGLAWRNLAKTSELQIRLVRASELNSHLKEMNLAAAGLAHETRNPLNIIRGMAQMISKQKDASGEIRDKSRAIIDEADRVAGQLNEFINYSRPREVRRARVELSAVVAEVVRALNYDLEEKKVRLQTAVEPLAIEADEQLLRQALFNLLLNAIQAVPENGEIRVRAGRRDNSEGFIELSDNGPGVSLEHRAEIFKPYFTTHPEGTGLGLAVVQQIVLAHGWEIEYQPNQPNGAVFRIGHLKLGG